MTTRSPALNPLDAGPDRHDLARSFRADHKRKFLRLANAMPR